MKKKLINDSSNQSVGITPDVSTPGHFSDDEITEQEKAAAWAEFEAEMRMLDYENDYNTYK